MTVERKLLIAAGALIIAFIIAVGFFSLGLYVGQHGNFPAAPNVVGLGGPGRPPAPGQPPQPGGDPGQPRPGQPGSGPQSPPVNRPVRPANLPPGPPDLAGPLHAVGPEGLTVGTPRGGRLVGLDFGTQVFDFQGESLSPEVLAVDTHVAVFGHFTGDRRTMVADTIVILPSPPPQPPP